MKYENHPSSQCYYLSAAAAAAASAHPSTRASCHRDTNREKGEVANQYYHCPSLAIYALIPGKKLQISIDIDTFH